MLDHPEAVHARHHQVDQQHGVFTLAEKLDRFLAVSGAIDLQTFATDDGAYQLADGVIVVSDQYPRLIVIHGYLP
jgi:hypothetical protein